MKTIQQMADEYAKSYPKEYRIVAARAWMDGRKSAKDGKMKKKAELDLSFVGDYYRDVFEYWLNYKKERNQKYTQSGAELCFRKLLQLSGGDRGKMIAIIEQSVSNNWAGLFELKNNGRYNQNGRNGNQSIFDATDAILPGCK